MKMLSIISKIFFLSLGGLFSAPKISKAVGLGDAFQTSNNSNEDPLDAAASNMGFNTNQTGINPVIAVIIQTALSFLGIVFIVLIVYGGYLYMTAHGNEQQVEKAQSLLRAAIIGLIIVVAAYAISYFVVNRLGEQTLQQTTSPSSL